MVCSQVATSPARAAKRGAAAPARSRPAATPAKGTFTAYIDFGKALHFERYRFIIVVFHFLRASSRLAHPP